MARTTIGTIAFGTLAVVAALVWLIAIVLHFVGFFTGHTYEFDADLLIISGILGFVGFYGLDSSRAKDGGAFIVTQGIRVLREMPKFGRRATDASAVPNVETTVTAVPTTTDPAVERGAVRVEQTSAATARDMARRAPTTELDY